jgi:hypothetical protein
MLQPVTPSGALLLLLAVTAAEAQPTSGRSVTLARPGEPLPTVRVAAKSTTTIVGERTARAAFPERNSLP